MNIKQYTPIALALLLVACQSSSPTPPPSAAEPIVVDPILDEDASLEDIEAQLDQELTDLLNDSEQYIRFDGKSSLVDHPGSFEQFTATYEPGATENFEDGTINVVIDVASITSDSDGLTKHLKEDDFFDTANYPTAEFISTAIVPSTVPATYDVTGDLTIKGVTQSIVGQGVYTGNTFSIEFLVPRAEFGIGNDSYGEKLLADEIPVQAQISL